jgi:glutaminase
VEPTGDAFNSISLDPGTGRPRNPMINAGAIATAGLIEGKHPATRFRRLREMMSLYAGRKLGFDEVVYQSESETGHRNRAIGHMLRNYGILDEDPEGALELYFRQCSVLVDCRDLALIAATLANGGSNPVTKARAIRPEFIGSILSVMTTCGMYDFSGEWAYRVGMPAKSGVGGGIIAVLPGQLGIGVFSPALDERGNSVRGVRVCESISADLGLHFLQPPRASAATVRARYSLGSVRSKRRRQAAENRVLDEHGERAIVYELQGDLRFATIERVLREIVEADASLLYTVLDFKRVTHADAAATQMLARLVNTCAARGQHVVLTRVRRGNLLDTFGAEIAPQSTRAFSFQPQLDLGLEWCEKALLERFGPPRNGAASTIDLADHRLCAGASAEDLAWLRAHVGHCQFEAGSTIVSRGDLADALYFLVRGEVSVIVDLPQGGHKRLSTLSAGMGFGEAALSSGGVRSATVRADAGVECYTLEAGGFDAIARERPSLMITLLRNLLQASNHIAVRLTAEVAALEG